jgi:hypothetical protein
LDKLVSDIEELIEQESEHTPAERKQAIMDSFQHCLRDTFKLVKDDLNNAIEVLDKTVRSRTWCMLTGGSYFP